jgi:hypothetical protein
MPLGAWAAGAGAATALTAARAGKAIWEAMGIGSCR